MMTDAVEGGDRLVVGVMLLGTNPAAADLIRAVFPITRVPVCIVTGRSFGIPLQI